MNRSYRALGHGGHSNISSCFQMIFSHCGKEVFPWEGMEGLMRLGYMFPPQTMSPGSVHKKIHKNFWIHGAVNCLCCIFLPQLRLSFGDCQGKPRFHRESSTQGADGDGRRPSRQTPAPSDPIQGTAIQAGRQTARFLPVLQHCNIIPSFLQFSWVQEQAQRDKEINCADNYEGFKL